MDKEYFEEISGVRASLFSEHSRLLENSNLAKGKCLRSLCSLLLDCMDTAEAWTPTVGVHALACLHNEIADEQLLISNSQLPHINSRLVFDHGLAYL